MSGNIRCVAWNLVLAGLFFGLGACARSTDLKAESPDPAQVVTASAANDEAMAGLLLEGRRLIVEHKSEEAISQYLDKVIADYETKNAGSEQRLYCARSVAESLMYMATAAVEKRDAAVLSSTTWADAYQLKGYALNESGREKEGRIYLEKALVLSPQNALYLEELGYTYQMEKNWTKALEIFHQAEDAANSFSPEAVKVAELSRALRGQGYVLTEQGKLDESEKLYRRCLEMNANDENAKRELAYIQRLRANGRPL